MPAPQGYHRVTSPAQQLVPGAQPFPLQVVPNPQPAPQQAVPDARPAPQTAPNQPVYREPGPGFEWRFLPDLSRAPAPELAVAPPQSPSPARCSTRKKRRSAQWVENTISNFFGQGTAQNDVFGGSPIAGNTVAQAGTQDAASNDCSSSF